jgi:MFS family permease
MQALGRKDAVLALTTLAFIAMGLSLFNYPAVSVIVTSKLGFTYIESGLVTSAFGLAYALMQIPGGFIADRYGGAKALLGSLAIVALAPLVLVLGGTFASALASRIIAGAACGVVIPSAIRLLSNWFTEQQLGTAMGIFGSAWGLSQIISFALLPALILDGDWRVPLLFTTVYSLVVALGAILPIRWASKTQSGAPGRMKINLKELFTRNLVALSLPQFVALAIPIGVLAWAPTFLTSKLSLTQVDAGRVIAIIGVTNVLASYVGGMAAVWLGKRWVIVLSMVLAMVFTILFGISSSVWMVIVSLAGIGWGGMLYFASVFALVPYASKRGPEAAGMTFGIFNTIGNVGNFVSPILLAYVLDSTRSFTTGFTVLGLVALLGVLGGLLLRDIESPGSESAELYIKAT